MKVEAIKHKDVRGKEMLYLKLTHEVTQKEVVINIGQKTFDAVSNMDTVTLPEAQLTIETATPKKSGK